MKLIFTFWFSTILIKTNFAQNRPELFVVSVGVSKYQNPKYNLQYAHKDAIDLAEAFKKQTELFDIQKVIVLTDDKATRANIRAELSKLKKLITPNDLFIFIFSGHGLNESLVTHDFNISDRTATSLQRTDLAELISDFNCNYMLLIDACHSGSFAKGLDIQGGKDIDFDFNKEQIIANEKLLRALNASDKANIVIGSSSSSERSGECVACQNGYFTQSILDAFDGKIVTDPQTQKTYSPDKDQNGFVYTNELDDYLKEVVSINTRANAINQSVISKQSPGFSFPISKYKDSDGDGTADVYDQCLNEKGTARGCPDADHDGVADKDDKCPSEPGSPDIGGCPSTSKMFSQVGNSNLMLKAIGKSLLMPGSGKMLINPKKNLKWVGLASYSVIALGTTSKILSNKALKNYNLSSSQLEIDKFKGTTKLWGGVGTGVFVAAAAIWITDLASLMSKKDKVAFQVENGNVGIILTMKK